MLTLPSISKQKERRYGGKVVGVDLESGHRNNVCPNSMSLWVGASFLCDISLPLHDSLHAMSKSHKIPQGLHDAECESFPLGT